MRKEDKIYQELYGDIPNTQMERIEYILGKRADNKLFNENIAITGKKIKRIKKNVIKFTMWKVVKPSARPRANTSAGYIHMYVPRAAENKSWFQEFAEEHPEIVPNKIITTPCILNLTIYEKTPSSFTMKQKVLAELGLIRPCKRTGDIDNMMKSVSDAFTGTMYEDDCLIVESTLKLFYSIKPHCQVELIYLDKNPINIK